MWGRKCVGEGVGGVGVLDHLHKAHVADARALEARRSPAAVGARGGVAHERGANAQLPQARAVRELRAHERAEHLRRFERVRRFGGADADLLGKEEFISDMWEKRGATYGRKGGVQANVKKRAKRKNSFRTYGKNGVRHMGEKGVCEFKKKS